MAQTLNEKLLSLPEERRQRIEARAAELIEQEARTKLWNRLLEGQSQKNTRSKKEIDQQINEERGVWDR